MNILTHRREIDEAIWAYMIYIVSVQGTEEWLQVAGGRAIRDEEVALLLGVSAKTVSKWRKKLVTFELVRCKRVRAGGFQLWVRLANFSEVEAGPLDELQFPELPTDRIQ